MSKAATTQIPHIELERKYNRTLVGNFPEDVERLRAVFNFVNQNVAHYVYVKPQENIDPELLALMDRPMNFKPARRRYYWANKKLRGYNEDDRADRVEVRTDIKNGSGIWDMDAKRGGPASSEHPTMRRDEENRTLKRNVLQFSGFPKYMTNALQAAFDKPSKLKPAVYIDSYTAVLLYHPDGREDITLEIKFDYGKGFNFMGDSRPVIEYEIEIKELPDGITPEEVQAIWDREEKILDAAFGDIERIYDSKPAPLFYDLAGRRREDKKDFGRRWDSLDPTWIDAPSP